MDTTVGFPSPADASTEHGVTLGSPNEYLDVALAAGRSFQDALPIVARAEIIKTLRDFVASPNALRVMLISGGAGTGKTSLLASMTEAVGGQSIAADLRFASDVASSAGPHAPRLPKEACVIVVDDAHRKPCVASLMQQARDREDVRFVFTCRPGGLSRLLALCCQTGLSANEYRALPDLEPLAPEDAERLASHALDEEFAAHAKQVAILSAGRPLLISLAGRLVREGTLHPVALEQTAEFNARVIERSYEALLLRLASGVDQKLVAGVLSLVAMLAPIRTSDERFLQGAGELLGCRRRDLVTALRALEHAGVLERAIPGARIIPSALADHAIWKGLVGSWPLSGTLADRVHTMTHHFGIHAIVPLLRNVGEMDGPSVPSGAASQFVQEIFAYCRAELQANATLDRCRLLSALRELGVDQPAAMLALARAALQLRPAGDAPQAPHVFLSETNVANELPAILQRITLHPHHLPRALDLLWELGRDDVRLQSPHPDHPMRLLRDFAARGHSRPLGFHEALLDAVDRWLAEPEAHDHKHSPIDVVDTFLAESDSEDEDGAWVTRLIGLRNQALQALARAACSPNRRAALSGVRALEAVLTNASISSSIGFPEPLWRNEERLEVLTMLRRVVTNTSDPFVHFAVADVFRWTAHRTTIEAIRGSAELALSEVPESSERRLYEALTQRPPAHRGILDAEMPSSSMMLSEQRNAEPRGADISRVVVTEWMAKGLAPQTIVEHIADALDTLSVAGKSGSPRRLLQVFSLRYPDAAAAACEAIMGAPAGPLGPHVAALLHTLRESAPDRASNLLSSIVSGGDATLCASLAQAFPKWVDKPRRGDNEALRELLTHQDGFVRRAALGALRTLAKAASRDAITLATQVDLSEEAEATEALFAALDGGKLFAGDTLSAEEIVTLLSRLTVAPSLDGHSTIRFLHLAGKRLPKETALLLLDRIGRVISGEVALIQDFTPLPPEGLASILARLPESAEWIPILRRIRDLGRSRSTAVRTQATRLFHAASKNYSPAAIEVLSEWVQTGGPEELEATCVLLQEAPAMLVFSHVHFVATLLRRSHALGGAIFDTVQNALLPIAQGQARHRTGAPHPSETALRAQAREAAAKLPPRSPEQRFFDTIVKHTESLIAEENEADHDDLFDL